jgi:transposase-like protein
VSKVDHIHAIDDGKMTDAEIALIVGCHRAYVRSVRQISKKQSAQVVAKSKVRASLKARITELERVCAELYQVLGSLSDSTELFDHPDVIRALDQASQARVVHDDLLPWPREALTKSNDKP